MLKHVDSEKMGRGKHDWLESHFHFSFADYYNSENMQFGVLRVVNDDLVKPGTGFDTHPHRDMEIISYVIHGELTHADSMKNRHTLTRGQVQYMSAGTGVLHSEHNFGKELLRFLQIWILPDREGYEPNYGDFPFKLEDRYQRWLPIASCADNASSTAPIRIHADVNIFATILTEEGEINFKVEPGRQAYMVMVEGEAEVEDIKVRERDALEITEHDLHIRTKNMAHILLLEMKKSH